MYITKLREIQHRLIQQSLNPEICRFNMTYFGTRTENASASTILAKPICGTQACIAGEAVMAAGVAVIEDGQLRLSGKYSHISMFNVALVAKKILNLTVEQAERLFYFNWMGYRLGWPERFEKMYKEAKTASDRALVGVQRIEYFIQTDGKDDDLCA